MKFGKKLLLNLRIGFNSLFRGMKAADDIVLKQVHGGGETEIAQEKGSGGVVSDMLQNKITNEIKEIVDANYRIFKKTRDYKVHAKWSESGPLTGTVQKKTLEDFLRHPPVLVKEGEKLRVIQDNKFFMKGDNYDLEAVMAAAKRNAVYDYGTLLNIDRNGYRTKFDIEKFVKRIVVKSTEDPNKARIDLYVSSYASQFGKIDAILVAQLNEAMENKAPKVDFLQFDGLSFVTDMAWNSYDLCRFKYDDIQFWGIDKFDGNFVLEFSGRIIEDGYDITEELQTESLTQKYEAKAPKKGSTDIFAICRKVEKEENNNNEIENLGTANF